MMVAFSVAMFANSYWYRGGDNSWGATAMTVSTDGLYEYIQSSNNANQFKIATSEDSWDYGWTYVQAGFNSTDVTNIGDYGQDNCYCWQSGDYYILVYYPNTAVNTTANPIICAATTLPEASAGNAETGDAIKLTFCYYNSTSGDGSAKLSTVEAIFDAASQQYVSTVNTGTQVYAGRKYKEGNDSIFSNLKLGSSKAGGELEFTLANPMEVDSIVFRAAMYSAAEGGDGFSVNGTSFALNAGKLVFEDKVWIPTGEVSTIDIVQNKANGGRFFLTSITIYPKAGETPEQPEEPEEVVLPVVKLAGSLSSWEEPVLMANAEDSLSATLTLNLGIDHYQLKVVSDGNWLSRAGEGDLFTMHRDYPHVDHLNLINSGDNIKLITDVEGEYTFTWTYADSSLVVTFPAAPAQPKFYITGNEDIVGEGHPTWGKNGALESFTDTLVMNLAAGFHKFKLITPAEQWLGMEALTDTAYGLFTDDDTNICFNLAEAGAVTVIYNANEFKVEGNFYVAPVAKYYLIGDSAFVVDAGATADKAWTPDAIASFKDTTVLNLNAGVDYIMRLSLNGTWENHRDFRHLTDTAAGLIELPDEFGNHSIGFSLAEAGEVTIIYIPAANEQPEVFKLIGDFYVYVPQFTDGYYLVGNQYNWTPAAERLFKANPETEGEFFLDSVVLAANDSLKVVYVENDQLLNWYPEGNNYVVDANRAGTKTIYFNPNYQKEWGGNIFIAENPAPKEYYAKYAEAWEWVKLTETEGLWLTDTIVYKGTGININDKAADEGNLFYSNEEIEGALPIAGAEIKLNDTIRFSFNPADSVVTAIMIAEYVAPVVVPTVSVFGSMTRPAWEVEIPFELSEDKTYATLYNDNIKPGEYTFKLQVNGDWRSNGYRYHRDFPGAAGITGNADADMTFVADQEGEYTFTWFFANDSLAITYPEIPFACDWNNIAWLEGSNEQIKVCKESEAVSVINVQKPGWAAEKGIYMTFPSAAWGAISLEEGSYVTEGAGLLVYLSALTQEYNEISIVCQDVEYIINVYNADNMPKPAFYLVGNFNEWTAAEAYKFALNPNNDAEYVLTATLAENDLFKVIRVMEGEETVWYPADAENYVVDAAHAGEKDIYFRPDYQGGEDWYAQCIYVAENAPQGGCDWDHIDFIGSAVPELADQFKLCKEGQYPSVINIQNSFGTEAGIYVTFPSAAFGEISMTEGTYAIQGAGMLLYCSAFTDVETEVSIVCDGNPIIFTVYNAEGSAPVVDPTVSVKGSMNDWAEEIPFVLSDDKTYASLTVENISAGNYEFKFIINGEWRSNGYRFHREFPGAAGITENNEANMTFEADIDGEYTFYWYFANDSAAIVYPAKPEPVLANGYYLVGSMNEWTPAAENLFALNPDNNTEYQLPINLAEGDEIKVVEVENDAIKTWFPNEGGNYIVDQNHTGATTMYFRPNYNGEEGWFAACIYVVPTSHTDIDNVNAAVEAVKIIREGQLLIIKGNKTFNAQGQLVK